MSQSYLEAYHGQIMLFAGRHVPAGWRHCDGALMAIKDNQVLYSVIGNIYGGDGHTTFALPDLRGKSPLGDNGHYLICIQGTVYPQPE